MLRKANTIIDILLRNGITDLARIAWIYLFEPWMVTLYRPAAQYYLKALSARRSLPGGFESVLRAVTTNAHTGAGMVSIEDLDLSPADVDQIRLETKTAPYAVIANIDQDGFFLPRFGPIAGVPLISKSEFVRRKRFAIDLVAMRNGTVGVKKDYGGNHASFLKEFKVLRLLSGRRLNVPTILYVDFKSPTLVRSFISGRVLREQLARSGAPIRDRDTVNVPEFKGLSAKELEAKRIDLGKRVLHKVVDDLFIEKLFGLVQDIHSCGVLINDIKYGNVIISSAHEPWWLDFDGATRFLMPRFGPFRTLRDADREKFNVHFGTEKLTRSRLVRRTSEMAVQEHYAPAYIGDGLRIGSLWNTSAGFGRWHYILKRNLPPFQGRRILDLGANNGFHSLTMLRNGAGSAVAVELNSACVAQGMFLKEAFEWSDNRRYDLRYILGSMVDIRNMDLGRFDIAMALCSLYYLDDDDIRRLIRHLAGIADRCVLECNTERNIGRGCEQTYERATVEYAVDALRTNGFGTVRVVAPRGYPRPLVIGSVES